MKLHPHHLPTKQDSKRYGETFRQGELQNSLLGLNLNRSKVFFLCWELQQQNAIEQGFSRQNKDGHNSPGLRLMGRQRMREKNDEK